RLGADRPIVGAASASRRDLIRLAGAAVVSAQFAAVDDVGVERIRGDVAVLLYGDRMPLAERDAAVVSTARHARGSTLLLAAAHAIRKRAVGADVVELRRRLVVPGAPALTAVDGHDRALIRRNQDDVGVVRVDPDAVV